MGFGLMGVVVFKGWGFVFGNNEGYFVIFQNRKVEIVATIYQLWGYSSYPLATSKQRAHEHQSKNDMILLSWGFL